MEADKIIGMASNAIQSVAIIIGLVLTVKSWKKSYSHAINAQIENQRNIIWDRAGMDIYSAIQNYNSWLIEVSTMVEFFLTADPLDQRFVEKGQNWRRAILERVNRLSLNHLPYQEWKNKLEYYEPALVDIDSALREFVIKRGEELIEDLNQIHKYEDTFSSTEIAKEEIRPIQNKIAEQGAAITDLGGKIREYCMKKTFFVSQKL